MAIETTTFDILDYLQTPEERAAYIEAAIEEGDPTYFIEAIGNVARAQGASAFAAETGLSRETIYKAFVRGGNPTVHTMVKALAALGLRLTVKPA